MIGRPIFIFEYDSLNLLITIKLC